MAIQLKANNANLKFSQGGGQIIQGIDGGYYIPAIDAQGNLTWTPTQTNMPAVDASNIMGPAGKDGAQGPKGDTGLTGPQGEPGESPLVYGDTAPEDTTKIWVTEDDSVEQIVYSNDISRIVVVTEYPEVQEPDVLYVKIEG